MEEINELIEQRIKKLAELRQSGIEPFGSSFYAEDHASELLNKFGSVEKEALEANPVSCSLAGRIISMRDFGKAAFAHIQDTTGKIQVYFKKDIETRYRQRYVDLIVNPEVRQTFVKRSIVIKAIRDFLESKGFIEVETPMMHPIPGGATARPFKTHHNALGIDLYLRIAPELYLKRLLVGGYERVYELNRNFRNEGISTKHNPEFTMLEVYEAYRDYQFLMSFTEELITYVSEKTLGTLKVPYGDTVIDLTPPWPRIAMLDLLFQKGLPEEIFNDKGKAKEWAKAHSIEIDGDVSLGKILDEIFKELVEPGLVSPTFITDYPVELSPLAKRKKGNPELTERFELFIASQEFANAFSELTDPIDQNERFIKQVEEKAKGDEEAHRMDEDFIRALEYGMPPAAGEGIGIDRLVMVLTNAQSIRDVILFPQLKPEQ